MRCWSCGAEIDMDRVSFRAVCDKCGMFLHCCKGCKHYKVGLANDCRIPDTERVVDKEAGNFCEDFVLGNGIVDAVDLAMKKKKFEDLF